MGDKKYKEVRGGGGQSEVDKKMRWRGSNGEKTKVKLERYYM